MPTKTPVRFLILLFTLSCALVSPELFANGGKAKNAVYVAEPSPPTGTGRWSFKIDSSPIIFYLGTVNKKYHVLLIRVRNDASVPLKLAKNQDSVELIFADGSKTQGLLNLPASDRATWDGLDTEMRSAVAYPDVVKAGEEEGIYVFVPVAGVVGPRKGHEMPQVIIYTIKSVPEPIQLQRPVAKA
jgi:hypothetical protein